MTPFDMLRIWLELECIGIDGYELFRIPGNTCDDVELILLARLLGRNDILYFRKRGTTRLLIDTNMSQCFEDERLIATIIHPAEIRREVTYHFPTVSQIATPDVEFLGDMKETLDTAAILFEGNIVSRAWSVRRNERAAEIAVETKEGFRRRGYGRQVVASWVNHILNLGKVPIYSHRKGNLESMALANSCGAVQFVEVLSYHD